MSFDSLQPKCVFHACFQRQLTELRLFFQPHRNRRITNQKAFREFKPQPRTNFCFLTLNCYTILKSGLTSTKGHQQYRAGHLASEVSPFRRLGYGHRRSQEFVLGHSTGFVKFT